LDAMALDLIIAFQFASLPSPVSPESDRAIHWWFF